MSKAMRESRYLTSFSSTKFFFDCDEILDLRSRNVFWTEESKRVGSGRTRRRIPLANSSSISRSRSCADMDRYRAVTLYRLDARTDLAAPSLEPTVFWRDTGTKPDEEDEAEFLVEGASVVVTDMTARCCCYCCGGGGGGGSSSGGEGGGRRRRARAGRRGGIGAGPTALAQERGGG